MSLTPSTTPDATTRPAVLVTGASSGIGKELARLAARDCEALLLIARSSDALAELAEELRPVCQHVDWLSVDLADAGAGDRVEEALRERGWHCDVLAHAAGLGLVGRAWQVDRGGQLSIIDVNVRALTDLALRFLPGMVARRGGGLLLVGSISGYYPGPNMAVYYASKAYVRSISVALSVETRGTGVTVTCLTPGFVTTPFLAQSGLHRTRVRKLMPRITAAKAALAGWQAFKAGRRYVMPNLPTRLVVGAIRMLPVGLAARLIQRLQG